MIKSQIEIYLKDQGLNYKQFFFFFFEFTKYRSEDSNINLKKKK